MTALANPGANAGVRECLRVPPTPDAARARLRAAVGIGQLGYGVLRLRRTGTGWYHVALGTRQVVQAKLDAAGAFSPAADAAVDGLHVATMLGWPPCAGTIAARRCSARANALGWALLDRAVARADDVRRTRA